MGVPERDSPGRRTEGVCVCVAFCEAVGVWLLVKLGVRVRDDDRGAGVRVPVATELADPVSDNVGAIEVLGVRLRVLGRDGDGDGDKDADCGFSDADDATDSVADKDAEADALPDAGVATVDAGALLDCEQVADADADPVSDGVTEGVMIWEGV